VFDLVENWLALGKIRSLFVFKVCLVKELE
jgi:hypothetical protein